MEAIGVESNESSIQTRVSKYELLTDEELMGQIVAGVTAAFDALYDRYSERMLYYFYRMLGRDEKQAQDFLQDLFIKIVEKPEAFDVKRKFSTWIYTLAGNMCKNEYRRLEVRRNGAVIIKRRNGNGSSLPRIESEMDNEEFEKHLWATLDTLDETKKSTFLLRHQEHCSIKEISEIMDVSEGTVKSRLFYTTKKLAEKLSIYDPKNKANE